MKLPITRETTGWATSETRSQRLAAVQPVEHLARDRADRILVVGDPLGREAALEERLDAIVLGRVHADEHRPGELHRERRRRRDAAEFGGVGLPVAADRVDVLGGRHRPEAGLLGTSGAPEALGSVHRTLATHAPEHLVRRAVLPQRFLRQFNVADIAFDGRHVSLPCRWPNYVLSRWEKPVRLRRVPAPRGHIACLRIARAVTTPRLGLITAVASPHPPAEPTARGGTAGSGR